MKLADGAEILNDCELPEKIHLLNVVAVPEVEACNPNVVFPLNVMELLDAAVNPPIRTKRVPVAVEFPITVVPLTTTDDPVPARKSTVEVVVETL